MLTAPRATRRAAIGHRDLWRPAVGARSRSRLSDAAARGRGGEQHLGDDRVRAVDQWTRRRPAAARWPTTTACLDQRSRARTRSAHLQRARKDDRQGDNAAMRLRRAGRSTAISRLRHALPDGRIFEDGHQGIDLRAPYCKGGKVGLFGGAGVGKTVLIRGADQNIATPKPGGRSVGLEGPVGERPARATTSGARYRNGSDRAETALVYGQNERAAGRAPCDGSA